MSQHQWAAVDAYTSDLFLGNDSIMDEVLAASRAARLPDIAVSPAQGKALMLLARMCRARSILEIGTLGGYSTIWLARAMPSDGHLITLEADGHHAEVATRNIAMAGFADQVTVRLGPALQTLPRLQAEQAGPFDLIFIDADKVSYPQYLTWALRLARPGTAIIADNVVRDGKVVDPDSDEPAVQGARSMLEQAAQTAELETTVLQTVGSKGWDGWAISVVAETATDLGATQPG